MKISEIFYSLQGEGLRKGTPTVFIRTTGCSAKNACYMTGIRCDTEFESGKEMSVEDIHNWIENNAHGCKEITWTGGEPADQLTNEITAAFKELGYFQAMETSGIKPIPENIDFLCISPKVAEHILARHFKAVKINELRYVRHKGQSVPEPIVEADNYWISPHSNGNKIDQENLRHCINLCLENPKWKLSVQDHKVWNIL